MSPFVLNIILATAWCLLNGTFSAITFGVGFAVAFLALWLTRGLYRDTGYFRRMSRITALVLYFFYDLVLSSLRVSWDVLTPRLSARPAILAMPLEARSDVEIMLVANLISLTPGTLSLDVSADRRVLYVHAMYVDDAQETIQDLKDGMERRVLEALE